MPDGSGANAFGEAPTRGVSIERPRSALRVVETWRWRPIHGSRSSDPLTSRIWPQRRLILSVVRFVGPPLRRLPERAGPRLHCFRAPASTLAAPGVRLVLCRRTLRSCLDHRARTANPGPTCDVSFGIMDVLRWKVHGSRFYVRDTTRARLFAAWFDIGARSRTSTRSGTRSYR